MANDKVMITISGLQEREVILASDIHTSKTLHQVDLFGADNSPSGAPERSEIQTPRITTKAPPEVAGAAQADKVVQPTVEAEQTAPAHTPAVLDTKKPWELASGDPTAVNFRPDMSLHAKMDWVCENVPKMSRLRIAREGAELLCNMLIEKHYRHQE